MIKVIITALIAVLITIGTLVGLNLAGMPIGKLINGSGEQTTQTNQADTKKNVPQIEYQIRDILIPVNTDTHQGLLLLEIAVYSDQGNASYVESYEAKIKNYILKTFSVKPEAYFLNENFFAVLQADLQQTLTSIEDYKINDVLVIKAVYQ